MNEILTKAQKRKINLDKFELAKKVLSSKGVNCSQISGTHQYRFLNIMYMGDSNITIDYYPIAERLFNLTTQEWDDCYVEDLVFNITGLSILFQKNEDELWGNVFAKIKQYGLNNEVLTILKQNYNISEKKA